MHATAHDTASDAPALRTLLRSVGQIVLQADAVTGACVLAALLVCDARLACAAVLGAATANVVALPLRHDDARMRDGLHGFNGALAALAAFSSIADTTTAVAVALLAASAASALYVPWVRWLQGRGLDTYSSPCLVVTWGWLALRHEPFFVATLPGPVQTTSLDPLGGVFASLAQTAFGSGALPGVLVCVGIAAASRRHACVALAGAALSGALQWRCGASPSSLDAGLCGFNGALAALALADGGLVAALAGATLAGALQLASQSITHPGGWPAMTAPFVVATWSVRMVLRWHWRWRSRAAKHTGDAGDTSDAFPPPGSRVTISGATRSPTRRPSCRLPTRPPAASPPRVR